MMKDISETIFNNSAEGILLLDREGKLVDANGAFYDITGYEPGESRGLYLTSIFSENRKTAAYDRILDIAREKTAWEEEVQVRKKNGELFSSFVKIYPIKVENKEGISFIAMVNSAGDRVQKRNRDIYYDFLTGLPNRILLNDRLDFMISHARRFGHILAVIFLDLDRFKVINEMLGFLVGDKLLQKVSERLKETVRGVDAVFRLGNDEFCIVLEEISQVEDAAKVAKKIQHNFSEPFKIDGRDEDIYVSFSIGISLFPYDGSDMETLAKNAEAAMSRAKEVGENCYQHYNAELDSAAFENLSLEHRLRRALEREEFLVYYQPIISMDSGRIIGAEALVRWSNDEMGLVSPGEFIPIAEKTGLIIPIGEWVLRTACSQVRMWHENGYKDFSISINFSARQFQRKNFVEDVKEIIDSTGLGCEHVIVELTESLSMKNPRQTQKMLLQMRELGLRVSLDDFGTGYSSLSYLKRFALDSMKIDRSFIRDILVDKDDANLVSLIVSMAHNLGMKVVAEGVEEYEHIDFLRKNRCDLMQGFYFSPPLPADKFQKLFQEKNGTFKL